ncbi:histidine kinase [Rhizobium sp. AQ_MP]|uniref:sensor histidine kinase n=1 Tax=Rhizobium sp. AQ_MP TaxID=2761536 RepID=UPI00163B3B91|nr:histidine kinase [Rhizobium sp. AQ_MP]MBC2775053.1 histidine kinase [Rhizobium sp. AQ_MP]
MKIDIEKSTLSLASRLWRKLESLSLSAQFLIAASLIVFGLMTGVSVFAAAQVERAALNAAGSASAVRMQILIAPLIKDVEGGEAGFGEDLQNRISALIGQGPEGQRIRNIKIWAADGRQLYPANDMNEKPVLFKELALALAGEVVVSRTTEAKHEYSEEEISEPLLEIYGPLVRAADGTVLLAGEIYEESEILRRQIAETRLTSMAGVFLLAVPMLSLLYLVVRKGARLIEEQRKTLRESLRNAIELSIENNRLRLLADNARVEAGKLNERILDQIGADLHDGSVQLLTLVKLRLSDLTMPSPDITPPVRDALSKIMDLVSNILDEVRNLSAGLILPELEEATIDEAVQLAVKRYLEITGRETMLVGSAGLDLRIPDLSICIYRFVLEGLMNSYRHANSNTHLVRYSFKRGRLFIAVIDIGERPVLSSKREVQRARLGKISQKRRIRNFGGRMRYFPRKNGSFAVASLPIGIVD